MSASKENRKLLTELFQRLMVTTQQDDDELNPVVMSTFSVLLKEDVELAVQLILEEIKSNNLKRSLRALDILSECMDSGGEHFQKKINKNKFLNNFIEMVTEKYYGEQTPNEIRSKIVEYLLLWTHKYPNLYKIKKVYDVIYKETKTDNKQFSTITTTNATATAAMRKPIFVDKETEEKFKKCLSSKNPEDHKLANLLVQQETNKLELRSLQNLELDNARRVVQLLDEMIKKNVNSCNTSSENETIKDLYEKCLQFSPIIRVMPEKIDEEELLEKALETNDNLINVIKEYENLYMNRNSVENENQLKEQQNDLINSNVADIDEKDGIEHNVKIQNETHLENDNAMDLKDLIFNDPLDPLSSSSSSSKKTPSIPDAPLIPIPLYTNNNKDKNDQIGLRQENQIDCKMAEAETDNKKFFDDITEQMFKEELKTDERIRKFNKESTIKKKSLNEIKRTITTNEQQCSIRSNENGSNATVMQKNSITLTESKVSQGFKGDDIPQNANNKGTELELTDIEWLLSNRSNPEIKKSKIDDVSLLLSDDEEMLSGAIGINSSDIASSVISDDERKISIPSDEEIFKKFNIPLSNINKNKKQQNEQKNDQEPVLSDIQLDLKSVKCTTKVSKITSDTQGLEVLFTTIIDRPNGNNDILAIVISIVNQGTSEITDLQLNAGVKMPCKLRLLESSKNYLPAFNPLQPQMEGIRRILLLYNPTKDHDINIAFILSYNTNESPNTINEPFEVKI